MYTTPKDVMDATGYTEVTVEQVRQAQFVIEIYTGRPESMVTSSKDKEMLARAVIAQTVYMRDKPDVSFNQMKVGSISRGEESMSFADDFSPFVAPLAARACTGLSWWNSRSIKIGPTFRRGPVARWDRD